MSVHFWVYNFDRVFASGVCPIEFSWDFLDGLHQMDVDVWGIGPFALQGVPRGINAIFGIEHRVLEFLAHFEGIVWEPCPAVVLATHFEWDIIEQ